MNNTNIHITEQEALEIGFVEDTSFTHDQFNTVRYKKDFMLLEFTYEDEKTVVVDLTIEDFENIAISKEGLFAICNAFQKHIAPTP